MANIRNNTTTIQSILETVKSLPEAGSGGVTPTGTTNITENGVHSVAEFAMANVQVPMPTSEDLGEITPSKESQTFDSATTGKLYSKVVIKAVDEELVKSLYPNMVDTTITSNAASSNYILSGRKAYVNGGLVEGNIAYKSSTSLSAVGSTVYVPTGYYSSQASKSIDKGTLSAPSISVNSSGIITATSGVSTAGYLDTSASSSKTYTLTSQDDSDFISSNIKSGVTIFGVTGSYSGSSVSFGALTGGSSSGTTYSFTIDTVNLKGFYVAAAGGVENSVIAAFYNGSTCSAMVMDDEGGVNRIELSSSNFSISTTSTSLTITLSGGYSFRRVPYVLPIYG